jgi:predicted ATPase
MLREFAEVVETLTAETPLVLVLEDLHWSDYATLDLLTRLAQRPEAARLLVLGTYRPADILASGHPLHSVRQTLEVHRQCTELALELLSAADVARYLQVRFPHHTFPAALGDVLHRRTDGNPLFLVNVVEALRQQGLLAQRDAQWTLQGDVKAVVRGVPESPRQLIEQQLARLTPEEQQLLMVASVAGVEFAAAEVAAGVEVEVSHIETLCDALVQRQLFLCPADMQTWPDGTVTARYRFIHALYQDVLYQHTAATRRLRLHQRLGVRLEAAYGAQGGEMAAVLAMHFTHGRDVRRAIQYWRQAAQNAARRHAQHEVIQALHRALELLALLPDTPSVPKRNSLCRWPLVLL